MRGDYRQVEAGGDAAAFLAAEENMSDALKLYGQASAHPSSGVAHTRAVMYGDADASEAGEGGAMQAQKKGETPDKISNRLVADAEAFSAAAKAISNGGDAAMARAALDKSVHDLTSTQPLPAVAKKYGLNESLLSCLCPESKLDRYFSHLPRDGKEPFGSGEAPPPPTEEEVAAAAAAKE